MDIDDDPPTSLETRALKLFSEKKKTPEEVAILLDQKPEDVMIWYKDHLRLNNMYKLTCKYEEYGGHFSSLVKLDKYAKKNRIGPKEIVAAVANCLRMPAAKREVANLDKQISERMVKLASLEPDMLTFKNRTYTRYTGAQQWYRW